MLRYIGLLMNLKKAKITYKYDRNEYVFVKLCTHIFSYKKKKSNTHVSRRGGECGFL